jgi:hypothetical protein
MKPRVSWVAVVLFALVACEKSGSKGSGEMSGADLDLFRSLPAGQTVVFGGNYMKLQNFMTNSAAGKLARQLSESLGKGMKEWMDCFSDLKDLKIAGTASFVGKSGGEMRMVMAGATLDQLVGCANKAGFKITPASDGKYVGIEIPSPMGAQTQGYLKLANGALYTRQMFSLAGGMPTVTPATRDNLEADIAGIAKNSVAEDSKMQAILAKADRSKTVWFAGSADGTPLSDKVGELYGSLDISPGLAFDVTAQITNADLAKKIEDGVDQMKKMADKMPSELKSVIEDLQLKRDGDRLRFIAKISDAQLAALVNAAGMFGGGLGSKPIHSIDVQPR